MWKNCNCIENLLFSAIRIIMIPHFISLAILLWVHNLSSSCLFSLLYQSNSKKNSNKIIFNSRNITLSICNQTIPSSIHHIFFLNIIHMTGIRQNKVHIFIFLAKRTVLMAPSTFHCSFSQSSVQPTKFHDLQFLQVHWHQHPNSQAPSQTYSENIKIYCNIVQKL